MSFRIASRGGSGGPAREVLGAAVRGLVAELEGPPDFMFAAVSSGYDAECVREALAEAGTDRIHGLTSCRGAMTDRGVHSEDGQGLALLAIRDPEGAYGSALAPMQGDPVEAGRQAVRQALDLASRAGEIPDLILVSASPGFEEHVLAGIQEVVGPHVPILGGSAADNEVAGEWRIWSASEVAGEGVVVSVLFPSVEVAFAFRSGYEPSDLSGVVTSAEGRLLREIDGEPAAVVYDRWTGGLVSSYLESGGNVLGITALDPIGRPVRTSEGVTYHRLAHPDAVTASGGLMLFAEVEEGATICAMRGSVDALVPRGGQVVQRALSRGRFDAESVSGALVTYCAGCMLALGDRVPEVAEGVSQVIPGIPYLGSFTFGEQGKFLGGDNLHSNLMISAIVFGR
jgi:hypothetical protein